MTSRATTAWAGALLAVLVGLGAVGCRFDVTALRGRPAPADAAGDGATDAAADGGPTPLDAGHDAPADRVIDAAPDARDAHGPEAALPDATPAPDGPGCTGPDSDGDGIPDACDPCAYDGPNATIALPVSSTEITITSLSINGGGNLAVLAPGAVFDFQVNFAIADCACPTCEDRVEFGFVPGTGVSACAPTGVPGCVGLSVGATGTPVAPSVPGQYALRFGLRRDIVCGADWWQGTPPETRTVGGVCVK